MAEVYISLYGDSAEYFEKVKEGIAANRGGDEPSNAEVVRRLLEEAEV